MSCVNQINIHGLLFSFHIDMHGPLQCQFYRIHKEQHQILMVSVIKLTCCITVMSDNEILGNPSVHLCKPERVGCHLPCWLALWKTTINNVTALINTYSLDQHACWWEPWPSPGYHGNTQGREECLQPHSLQLWIQANCRHLRSIHTIQWRF